MLQLGYFNYSTFENQSKEVYSEDVDSIDEQYANVGDAVLVSNNETENSVNEASSNENNSNDNVQTNADANVSTLETAEENATETTTVVSENDYYASAKLDRDKMYAEMISNYEKIINNTNTSEAQKSIATQEITKINNTKNAIMISENLIGTKGFNNCVILVNDNSVNVVVNVDGGLNKENVAKLQNIVSRELKVEIENIHIMEKKD